MDRAYFVDYWPSRRQVKDFASVLFRFRDRLDAFMNYARRILPFVWLSSF